jgi:DNA-binding response OmpR family regulator
MGPWASPTAPSICLVPVDKKPALGLATPMQVLVVEDDARVASYLSESLQAGGYGVQRCETAEEARTVLATGSPVPDILILDRLLKGEDGMSLIQPFRLRFPNCRIVVLSAVNFADEKATALDQGADDYMAKPFSFNELSARLRALSRRSPPAANGMIFQCRDVIVDLRSQGVSVEGRRMDLGKKEFQLLCALIEHPGRVYHRFQLLDRIWDVQADIESNVVEVTVNALRKKLKEANSRLEVLSKRNVGYWVEN